MINLLRRLWARPAPGPVSARVPVITAPPPPPPEPVTDPLAPGWQPDGELLAPLFYDRATPEPPKWTWNSFTEAWPLYTRLK